LFVRGVFSRSETVIFGIQFHDLDAQTYVNKDSEKCLIVSENEKKEKTSKKCMEQHHTLASFVVSVDGMLATEAVNTFKCITQLLSKKWLRPYSSTFGCVKSPISIAVVSATNLCLRGTT